MIADWFAQWPAMLAAFAVLFAPGFVVGAALRLRGLALWSLAPIGSVALIGILSALLPMAGIAWGPVPVAIGCLAVAVVAWFVGRSLRREAEPRHPSSAGALIGAGLAIGIVVGALRLGFYIGDPAAVSQTNDAVFHLNAVRFVLETGSASPLHLSGVIESTAFYPSAWHAVTSLVVLSSGATVPVAANAVALVIAAAIWPVGIAWFTRIAAQGSAAVTAFAAALSPFLLVFPLLMFEWGVLYPYAMSLALVPAAAAVVVDAPDRVRRADGTLALDRTIVAAVLAIAGVGAIALTQPASLLAWSLLVMSWFGVRTLQQVVVLRRTEAGRRRAGMLTGALVVAVAAFSALWIALALGAGGSHWPPVRGRLEALVDIVLNRQLGLPAAVGVSILAVVGIVVAVRRPRLQWLALAWLLFSWLYFVGVAVGFSVFRRGFTGAWYADPYRVAALAPLVVVPLAAVGLAAIVGWIATALGARADAASQGRGAAIAVGAIGVLGAVTLAVAPVVQMPLATEGTRDTESRYDLDADSFLSTDERALLERLDELVPADARVIANPSTGATFGYMISGRDVYPRTWSPPRTPQWETLAEGLRDAATDPAVCEALETLGSPRYVLDFGPGETTAGRFVMPGMTDFGGQAGFERVAQEGAASLWRITACD